MNDAQRKRLCASVVRLCYLKPLNEMSVADIEKQIMSTAPCQKMNFSELMSNGKRQIRKKRMYQCPAISIEKQQIKLREFYLSAGGKLNSALVFLNDPTDNGKNGLRVSNYVENLGFETDQSELLPV